MIIILLAAAAVSGVTSVYAGESFADVVIILAVVPVSYTHLDVYKRQCVKTPIMSNIKKQTRGIV